jgi:hypothetical protein
MSLGITTIAGLYNKPASDESKGRQFNYDAIRTPIIGEKDYDNRFFMPLPFTNKSIQAVATEHFNRAL